jgi:hypothetical protein
MYEKKKTVYTAESFRWLLAERSDYYLRCDCFYNAVLRRNGQCYVLYVVCNIQPIKRKVMRRFRFNTKVGRSAGLGAFRNNGSDLFEYACMFRTCSERGRLDVVNSVIDYSTTIYGNTGYVDTTNMWNAMSEKTNVWHKDYWLHEDVDAWTKRRCNDMCNVYDRLTSELGCDFFNKNYIPVYYDNTNRSIRKDFYAYAQYLMTECAGWKSMELRNYAMRILDDGRMVLYARKEWLQRFKVGCDLINYYRIARSRNFEKVYGF